MGFKLISTDRNHIQKPLGLRSVIGVVILASVYLDADVACLITDFCGIEGQVIPAFNRWVEVVIEKGVAVAVVRPSP